MGPANAGPAPLQVYLVEHSFRAGQHGPILTEQHRKNTGLGQLQGAAAGRMKVNEKQASASTKSRLTLRGRESEAGPVTCGTEPVTTQVLNLEKFALAAPDP